MMTYHPLTGPIPTQTLRMIEFYGVPFEHYNYLRTIRDMTWSGIEDFIVSHSENGLYNHTAV